MTHHFGARGALAGAPQPPLRAAPLPAPTEGTAAHRATTPLRAGARCHFTCPTLHRTLFLVGAPQQHTMLLTPSQ